MALTRVLPTLVDDVPSPRSSSAPARESGAAQSVAGLLSASSDPPRTVRAAKLLVRLGLGAALSFGVAFLLADPAGWPAVAWLPAAFVLTTIVLRAGATRWRPVFAPHQRGGAS